MTEEQHRAILSLCGTDLPQASHPGPDEADYLRIIDSADSREVLPEFASQLWTSRSDERICKLSGYLFRVAEKIPVASWPALDQTLRNCIRQPEPSAGPLKPARASNPFRWSKPKTTTPDPGNVLIGLCHWDGWTRQAAMEFIDLLPPFPAACLLLVRANDWAISIQTTAASCIPQTFEKLTPTEKLRVIPLVSHLRNCGRLYQRSLPDTWIRLLSRTLNEEAWLDAWSKGAAKDQRLYLSLLDPDHHVPGPAIRNGLLRSKNRVPLIFYLKHIFPRLPEDEQEAAVAFVERSRVVPVRRAWLDHIIDQRPEAAQPMLIKDLVSISKSLRDFARFHLARLAPMDFSDHYRKVLEEGTNAEGALLGLADVSPEVAHHEALKRLASPVPKLRKAAILSLSPAWVETNIPWFLSRNGWSCPAVWCATRKRLGVSPRVLGDFVLREFDKLDLPLAISLYLIQQAPRFKKWDGLEYLLMMASDPLLKEDAKYALRIWRRNESKTYAHLSKARKQRLFPRLDVANLTEQTKEHLRFLLERAE